MSVNVYDKNNDKLNLIAGGILYADAPIGEIHAFGGSVVPSGYLLCNGQAVSRTEYSELFAVIGTAYGKGDNSTTFNVPDLREAVPKGAGLSGKSNNHYDSDGVALGEFIEDRIQDHRHEVSVIPQSGGSQYIAGCSGGAISKSLTDYVDTTIVTSTRKGVTTEVKAVGVNYIIKAKHAPVPADFSDSLIGYLGKETNYNLYPWSHTRTQDGEDISTDIIVERDGWYSIDYTLSSGTSTNHSFTLRDFDSQGEVHTIMRCHNDRGGTLRQTYLVPLKAGTYRYSHGGVGTLNVYMNRRDFA